MTNTLGGVFLPSATDYKVRIQLNGISRNRSAYIKAGEPRTLLRSETDHGEEVIPRFILKALARNELLDRS